MRRAAKAAILIFMLTIPALAQNRGACFDPDGSFWLLGDSPTGFSEFSAINLNAKFSYFGGT